MYKKAIILCATASALLTTVTNAAETATVKLDLTSKKAIGGVTKLDRKKYFGAHSGAGTFHDRWNPDDNQRQKFIEPFFGSGPDSLGMSFGRGFSVEWALKTATEDPNRPGYWNPESFIKSGGGQKALYDIRKKDFPLLVDDSIHEVIGTTHPEGIYTGHPESFAFFPTGTDEASRHAALSDAFVNFYRYTAWPKPKYFEVMNECNVKAKSIAQYKDADGNNLYSNDRDEVFDDMCRLHNSVAKAFKSADAGMPAENHVSNIKIGGPTAAWPVFERNNFSIWERDFKKFIDIAGNDTDFYSVHFYDGNDGAAEDGGLFRRSGGNIEAILDMIDTYSLNTIGTRKPIVISEWGLTEKAIVDLDEYRKFAWDGVCTENTMVMQFMSRPDRIEKTMPFNVAYAIKEDGTGVWTTGMFRYDQDSSEWVEGDIMHYYRLWKDVKGDRLSVTSSDIDVVTQAFIDGDKVYLCINNSQADQVDVTLPAISDAVSATISRSYKENNASKLIENQSFDQTSTNLMMSERETVVITYTLGEAPVLNSIISENEYYAPAEEFLRTIAADTPLPFNISIGEVGTLNSARLNLSLGRSISTSFAPTVHVNGNEISYTPDTFATHISDDISFTRIELDIPVEYIQSENVISVTFPEDGGHLSTGTMTILRNWNSAAPATVTFRAGTYGAIASDAVQSVEIGGAANEPQLNVTEGYTFLGWDKSFDYVTSNTVVTAQYKEDAPFKNDAFIWFEPNGVTVDSSNTVLSWNNQADDVNLAVTGAPQLTKRAKDNSDVVRFNGDSYVNLASLYGSVPNGPATAFAVYSRESTQVSTSTWQRVLSAVDTIAGGDNKENGFAIGTGKTVTEIETTVAKVAKPLGAALNKITIGANARGFNQKFFGDISEILVYNRALTAEEEIEVENYLKSKWVSYSVAFEEGLHGTFTDGSTSQMVFHGKSATAPTVAPEAGYAFTGWNGTADSITKDVVLTAQYSLSYNVEFNAGVHGTFTGESSQIVFANNAAVPPVITPEDGYTFLGWDKSFDVVTSDMVITARYRKDAPYKDDTFIWLEANNVTVDENNVVLSWNNYADNINFTATGAPLLTKRAKDNSAVIRFNADSYLNLSSIYTSQPDSPVTAFAVYSRESGQVTTTAWQRVISSLDSAAGADNKGIGFTVGPGKVVSEMDTTIASFTSATSRSLNKICIGANAKTFQQKLSGDVSEILIYNRALSNSERIEVQNYLTSKWVSYNVTFDLGINGSIASGDASQAIFHGKAADAPIVQPNSGYIFTGWSAPFDSITADTTITAQYEQVYTVEFNAGDNGSLMGDLSQILSAHEAAVEPTVIPNAGYAFTGWDTDFSDVTSNLIVTAQYDVFTFSVTFKPGSFGSISSDNAVQIVEYGNDAAEPVVDVIRGYRLTGWDIDFTAVTQDLVVTANYEIDVTNELMLPPAFDPTVTDITQSGLFLWIDAAFGIETDNNDTITKWSNLAAPNRATLISGSPKLVVRSQDNLPVIRFDGASTLRMLSPEKEDSDVTMFAVFNRDADSEGGKDWQTIVSTRESTPNLDNGETAAHIGFGSIANEGIYKPRMIYPLPEKSEPVYENKSLKRVGIGVNSSWFNNHYLTGDVSEVLIYDKVLTDEEQLEVQEYLKTKWFSYNVSFSAGEHGTIADENPIQSIRHGQAAVAPVVTPGEGRIFNGWDLAFDKVTSDLVVTAQYKLKTFTVTFQTWAQSATIISDNAVQEVEYGSAAVEPELKLNEGYKLDRWSVAFDNITEDLKVQAITRLKWYEVTFNAGEYGAVTDGKEVQWVMHGNGAAAPVITADEAYNFVGWDLAFDVIKGKTTITAQYELKTFTVTFDAGEFGSITDGDAVQTIVYDNDAAAPVVTPVVSHNFTGWDIVFNNVTSDLVATAQYAIKTFTVEFVAGNKGTITAGDASQTIGYGSAASSPLVTPVIEEYEFAGWDVAINNVTSNITATALYNNNGAPKFRIIFIAAKGGKIVSGKKVQRINYAEAAIAPVVEAKDGYIFEGWDTAFDNITKNIRVRAEFSKKTYTVTFDAGAYGEITSDNAVQMVKYGERAERPTVEVDNEYIIHRGWEGKFHYVRGDIVITAKYKVNYPTIQYPLIDGINIAFITTLPEDPSMDSVMEPVKDILEFVEDDEGNRFFFNGTEWINEIGDLEVNRSYAISVNETGSLPITGVPVDTATQIHLFEGHNVIAYTGKCSKDPRRFFADIMDRIEYVSNDQGKRFRQRENGRWISSFGAVRPNEAYIIKMKEGAILEITE